MTKIVYGMTLLDDLSRHKLRVSAFVTSCGLPRTIWEARIKTPESMLISESDFVISRQYLEELTDMLRSMLLLNFVHPNILDNAPEVMDQRYRAAVTSWLNHTTNFLSKSCSSHFCITELSFHRQI